MVLHQHDEVEQLSGVGIQSPPDSATRSMDQEIKEAGGEWKGNPEDEGAVGWTAFDSLASDDGTITVLIPKDSILELPHQSLVRIKSRPPDGRSYLGAVVKGPFAEPDGLRADAPIVVTATVRGQGRILIGQYHGRVQVELIGEELENGFTVPPRHRPLPNSPIYPLSPGETAKILKTDGDILLGVAESHDAIEVRIPIAKSVLPRHLGVLGTTGGGKSTTVSGLIVQLQKSGVACVVLDTEGEYTAINEATEDPQMLSALERRGLKPQGAEDTHVYHLVGRDTANPEHPRNHPFRLDFSELSPFAVQEMLDLTGAQEQRFLQAYDVCKLLLHDLGVYPTKGNKGEEQEALEIDEMERGYPRMTLSHLIDIASAFRHIVAKDSGALNMYNNVFINNVDRVKQRVQAVKTDSEVSWRALLMKLWRLHRFHIFDNPQGPALPYADMLQPGRISIVDLSDTDSPVLRNLAIAQLLRGVQQQQEEFYQLSATQGQNPTPVIVFIEEAHEFLSAQRIKNMPVLFQQVARIARRGRKRWLGLVFVTSLARALLVAVDPTPSKLLMVK